MSNSFLNKVTVERRVLTVVNAKLSRRCQLTGLSSAAIDLWRRKIGFEITTDVANSLIVLADLCNLLSDRSHESFQSIDTLLSEKIESHLSILHDAVTRMP